MEANTTDMDNLYPALAECFVIIICGYFAGRLNLITNTEAKGINTFVGTFALPSLIFMSLGKLDLSSVNWYFLLSILIAKGVVFFLVVLITLLVGRPINFGRSGLFAIFCTQSNDFAIGYPIVMAIYKNTHPEYPSYLYLMAPISLAILNPIGFILMEIGKRNACSDVAPLLSLNSDDSELNPARSRSSSKEKLKMVVSVGKSIVLNPIILMTLLGILGNLIFKHHIPELLAGILNTLGSAFSASALFLLGIRMVGKVNNLQGVTLVVPCILIIVKLLVLPIVSREVISLLHPGVNATDTSDLSTFGFLVGTFPAAPTVFVFSTLYSIDVDLIASAMVVCTFISVPLMYVSAKMITITNMDPSVYILELESFTFTISIIGIVACCWVLIVFVISKKFNKIPHRITSYLVISQLITCVGAVLWTNTSSEDISKDNWLKTIHFALTTIGIYSSRLWTALLAVSLLYMQCRSLCYVWKLQPLFIVIAWGTPTVIAMLFLFFDKENYVHYHQDIPNLEEGFAQILTAVCLLVLCFIVTVGCLILHQRYRKRFERYLALANDVATTICPSTSDDEALIETSNTNINYVSSSVGSPVLNSKYGILPTINETCGESNPQSPVVDIEDLVGSSGILKLTDPSSSQTPNTATPSPDGTGCALRFGCHGPQSVQCHGILERYQQEEEPLEEDLENHEPQVLRHIVLLILLLCSMFVALSVSIWTLIMEDESGIYIELSFIDTTLNYGQGIIVFAVFGLDTKEIVLPVLKFWRRLWYGADTLNLPAWHELTTETRHICDQFVTHHLTSCKKAIAKDMRWRIKIYKNSFRGSKFVDWLVEVGLARDRTEAVNYARHLLEGKVLKHINDVHHFYDRNLLYTFV